MKLLIISSVAALSLLAGVNGIHHLRLLSTAVETARHAVDA